MKSMKQSPSKNSQQIQNKIVAHETDLPEKTKTREQEEFPSKTEKSENKKHHPTEREVKEEQCVNKMVQKQSDSQFDDSNESHQQEDQQSQLDGCMGKKDQRQIEEGGKKLLLQKEIHIIPQRRQLRPRHRQIKYNRNDWGNDYNEENHANEEKYGKLKSYQKSKQTIKQQNRIKREQFIQWGKAHNDIVSQQNIWNIFQHQQQEMEYINKNQVAFDQFKIKFQEREFCFFNLNDQQVFKRLIKTLIRQIPMCRVKEQFLKILIKEHLNNNEKIVWGLQIFDKILIKVLRVLRQQRKRRGNKIWSQTYSKIVKTIDQNKNGIKNNKKRKRRPICGDRRKQKNQKNSNQNKLRFQSELLINIHCILFQVSLSNYREQNQIIHYIEEFQIIVDFVQQYLKQSINSFHFCDEQQKRSLQIQLQENLLPIKNLVSHIMSVDIDQEYSDRIKQGTDQQKQILSEHIICAKIKIILNFYIQNIVQILIFETKPRNLFDIILIILSFQVRYNKQDILIGILQNQFLSPQLNNKKTMVHNQKNLIKKNPLKSTRKDRALPNQERRQSECQQRKTKIRYEKYKTWIIILYLQRRGQGQRQEQKQKKMIHVNADDSARQQLRQVKMQASNSRPKSNSSSNLHHLKTNDNNGNLISRMRESKGVIIGARIGTDIDSKMDEIIDVGFRASLPSMGQPVIQASKR